MKIGEWHERSFFIELKPRAEFASLFVDCPPHDGAKEGACSDVVRVGEHWVVLEENSESGEEETHSFRARIDDLSLSPESICAPTWTDNHRLFMCKVHADASNLPLVPKTFHRLARDMTTTTDLEEFVEASSGGGLYVECAGCGAKLIEKKPGDCSVGALPSEDFLETSPGGDFYCRDTCGAQCDPFKHSHHGDRTVIGTQERHDEWTPRKDYALMSNTTIVVHRETMMPDAVTFEEKMAVCGACNQPLGALVKNHASFIALHDSVTTIRTNQPKSYLETRFCDMAQFFALLILGQCEAQSSLKLVIRSLDKTPHILVWLLDSYVVLASGDLVDGREPASSANCPAFPAIKMLYKVFDANTAASDPRANGEDASVGLMDVPLGCALKIVELLLQSSHTLPPACRSVGQFYVGFLNISDSI
ncbi:hypothetical protein PENTCL1PPCAC_10468 [Pristionchus entomophagus]|uniref:E3 ubiquitin-protein ligase E3D n=1 Tax=Pristionchus entomophagus TaxID=358040 RepID=A0AAV5SYZ7_9BILA|nr:hypothetical protein PENTCL1PPCAC_10468 [Pristionchus entomophagus]